MVKRFQDVPYYTFSFFTTDMVVVCPQCGQAGTVRYDNEHRTAQFQCKSCYTKKEKVPYGDSAFEVKGKCTKTGRYFRVSVPDNKIHGQKLRVQCPYCEESVIGDVSDKRGKQGIFFVLTKHAEDPFFHYPLYFQASFRGKTIWALNREHLQYLIDYLSADLRTVEPDFHEKYKTMRSQSDILPAFMKTAKNREGIVKELKKLQMK